MAAPHWVTTQGNVSPAPPSIYRPALTPPRHTGAGRYPSLNRHRTTQTSPQPHRRHGSAAPGYNAGECFPCTPVNLSSAPPPYPSYRRRPVSIHQQAQNNPKIAPNPPPSLRAQRCNPEQSRRRTGLFHPEQITQRLDKKVNQHPEQQHLNRFPDNHPSRNFCRVAIQACIKWVHFLAVAAPRNVGYLILHCNDWRTQPLSA